MFVILPINDVFLFNHCYQHKPVMSMDPPWWHKLLGNLTHLCSFHNLSHNLPSLLACETGNQQLTKQTSFDLSQTSNPSTQSWQNLDVILAQNCSTDTFTSTSLQTILSVHCEAHWAAPCSHAQDLLSSQSQQTVSHPLLLHSANFQHIVLSSSPLLKALIFLLLSCLTSSLLFMSLSIPSSQHCT